MNSILRSIAPIVLALTFFATPAFPQVPEVSPIAASVASRAELKIPILVRKGRMYVQAKISGKSALLLIDTGTQQSAFKFSLVPPHKGIPPKQITIQTATGKTECPVLEAQVLIQDFNGSEQQFLVSGIFGPFDFGICDGLLGMDVLGRYAVINFDLKEGVLILVQK